MSDEGSSSDDDEYEYADEQDITDKKFPIHDCCEFSDVEALKNLLYSEVDDEAAGSTTAGAHSDDDNDDDDEEEETEHHDKHGGDAGSSSSDDNDSTAAAHAAAIGHSPHPIKAAVLTLQEFPNNTKLDLATTKATTIGSASQTDEVTEPERETPLAPQGAVGVKIGEEARTTDDVPASSNEAVEKASTKEEGDDSMEVDDDKGTEPKENGTTNGAHSTEESMIAAPKVTKLKLRRDMKLNARDDDENTALHVAILARSIEHVKVLLEAGANFRIKCDGSLPIHLAISMGSLRAHRQFAYECVVLLHEHGADVSAKDDANHSPLFLTCMFNLPQLASYILSTETGLSTLNGKADRAGNRPLHAAAKFDTIDNPSVSRTAASVATGQPVRQTIRIPSSTDSESIPGYPGKMASHQQRTAELPAPLKDGATTTTEALLTEVLLNTNGVDVDALNIMGQTALHIACTRRNWPVARLLIQAGASTSITDRRGHTPGHLAHKRAMPIPNDLSDILGEAPESGVVPPPRELIVDPDGSTLLLCHEACLLHRTCPPIRRDSGEPPPENVRRLQVLIDPETGILRSGEFSGLVWNSQARRAAIADVLRVHEYSYVERVSLHSLAIPDHPNAIAHLDPDTAVSRWSFEAAMRAAGSICEAVDRVVAGENIRNAFCAVRPPGHHAGPRGIVKCANDLDAGSHGFCLLNNVCIGAAYARSMYRNEGIRKVAIIDFDVHHGNGTEEIVRQLIPGIEKGSIRTPFAYGEISSSTYHPWLDETDVQNVFFASTHGFGPRGYEQPGWFYPASGKTNTSESITRPSMIETPNTAEFILSQTWARVGEDFKTNCCKIINVGLDLPDADTDQVARSMRQRIDLRDSYRKTILPALREFDPDLIFISAGFDAHRKDTMNFGYVGMVEDDYEWVTDQLVRVANTCCNGRVVSVLEGGYKIHGGIVSPFARSVASHVRALVDGGRSRELYDPDSSEWESKFEQSIYEKRERKKEQEREQLRLAEEANRKARIEELSGRGEEDPDAPNRKRRRNQVNYKELFKQMQQEGFAG